MMKMTSEASKNVRIFSPNFSSYKSQNNPPGRAERVEAAPLSLRIWAGSAAKLTCTYIHAEGVGYFRLNSEKNIVKRTKFLQKKNSSQLFLIGWGLKFWNAIRSLG